MITLEKPSDEQDFKLPFTDVPEDAWYYSYVLLLTERGLIDGYSPTVFAPEQTITRAEFTKLIATIADVDLSSYTGETKFVDVPTDAWYGKYVQWATDSGIIYGKSDTLFEPNVGITREEVAVIIYRFGNTLPDFAFPEMKEVILFKDNSQISKWAIDGISALQQADVLLGNENQYFNPQDMTRRSEAVKIIAIYYQYFLGYIAENYIEENQEELNAEMAVAQGEMENLSEDPNATQYFNNAIIDTGISSTSGFIGDGFQFLDGDILYQLSGTYYVGHIGIACGSGILEMVSSGPQRVSYKTWANRYKKNTTYVLRRIPAYCNGNTNCRSVSIDAAWYGSQYFLNGAGRYYEYPYYVIISVNNNKKANCATLAYKCYRDGAGFYYKISVNGSSYYIPNTLLPVDIFDSRVYNGFSAIYKF